MTGGKRPSEPRLRIVALHSPLAGPFDLSVASGECVAIFGPSGSGKSLLLRMIADLDPSQGQVFLDGRERQSFAPPAWRHRVVYSASEPGWWYETAGQHFRGTALEYALALMPRLNLTPSLLDSAIVRLSTGERQRLALIRALVLNPPMLLLDEPTGSLDQDNTARVEDLLRQRLSRGTAMLLVSHSTAQAESLGQRRFRMQDRRLIPT